MNTTFQSIRVGVFFVLGLVLIYAVYAVIGSNTLRRTDGYSLTATFDDLRSISAGTDVRVAGVRIGEVVGANLENGRGQVELFIEAAYPLPNDSVAKVMMSSLLGQNFLAVDYGNSAEFLRNGDRLRTQSSPDFNQILQEVQSLGAKLNQIADGFAGFGGDSMNSLFDNLNALVTDNRERIDNSLRNLETLSFKLNQADGTLGKLINEDGLYVELMEVVATLRSGAEDMGSAFGGVRDLIAKVEAGEGTLGRLLSDDTIAREMEATVANLRQFSEDLKDGRGTLGKLVSDDSLYLELQGMLRKADQALDNLGDAGPITALGALSGALF